MREKNDTKKKLIFAVAMLSFFILSMQAFSQSSNSPVSGTIQDASHAVLPAQADDSSQIVVYGLLLPFRNNPDGSCTLATSDPDKLVAACIVKVYRAPNTLEQVQANAAMMKGIPAVAMPVDTGATTTGILQIPYATVLRIKRGPKTGRLINLTLPKEKHGKPSVDLLYTNAKGKKEETIFVCENSSDADQLASIVTKRTGKTAVMK